MSTIATAEKTPPATSAVKPAPVAGSPANNAKATAPAPQLREVPLDNIEPSRLNPRKAFDKDALQELADSIKANGVLQPIVVRRTEPKAEFFEIVMGERRYRATGLAGLKSIPAVVHEVLSDCKVVEMALVENLQREDMNCIEEAEGYAQLHKLMEKETGKKVSHDQLADVVGKPRPTVTNALRLLELPEDVLRTIRDDKLKAAHGMALLRYKAWPKAVQMIAKYVLLNETSAGELEKEIPWALRQGLSEAGLMFDPDSHEHDTRAVDWQKLINENSGKFAQVDDQVYCFDPKWALEQIAAAKAAVEKREQEALEKAKAKNGGKDVLPVLKIESYSSSWTALNDLPAALRGKVPEEVKRKAVFTNRAQEKGQLHVVVPVGVARALVAKANRQKNETARHCFSAMQKDLHGNRLGLECMAGAEAVLAHEVLRTFGKKKIERAAQVLGITLPDGFLSRENHGGGLAGGYGAWVKQCDMLLEMGAPKASALAAMCLHLKDADAALAQHSEKVPDRFNWHWLLAKQSEKSATPAASTPGGAQFVKSKKPITGKGPAGTVKKSKPAKKTGKKKK